MCGIVGIPHADPTRPADAEVVRRLCGSLVHRRPDCECLSEQGPVGLGMRRLAIIDVLSGDQPLYSKDSSAALLRNGETYKSCNNVPRHAMLLEEHREAHTDRGALLWILLQLAGWCERADGTVGRA